MKTNLSKSLTRTFDALGIAEEGLDHIPVGELLPRLLAIRENPIPRDPLLEPSCPNVRTRGARLVACFA